MNKKASYSQAKHAYLNQINYKIKKVLFTTVLEMYHTDLKEKRNRKEKNKALRKCCKFPDYRFKYKEKKKKN